MPTPDRGQAISIDEAVDFTERSCFTPLSSSDGIGLETEFFVIRTDDRGRPLVRVRLAGETGLQETLDRLAEDAPWLGRRTVAKGNPVYPVDGGGHLSFEPGGQLEFSSGVHETASSALDELARVIDRLRQGLGCHCMVLAATGVDRWHDVCAVPQQLEGPRYPAMAAFFERIGPWGATMMRHTASTQVNLDFGSESESPDRWLAANLVSPLVTATFAASPVRGSLSARTQAWQRLDPSRTGFPKKLGAGHVDRMTYVEAALDATVMLFWREDGQAEPGVPGFSFRTWIDQGHPTFGRPTVEDLDYHLSTLFFEVRPRGFLELRAIEALPDALRAAPVVLLSGLLYDREARRSVVELLMPNIDRLGEIWRTAAVEGVRNREIRAQAMAVWQLALEGAARLPNGFLSSTYLEVAEGFLERFTHRGRMPADEFAVALAAGPGVALRWSVDGVFEPKLCG